MRHHPLLPRAMGRRLVVLGLLVCLSFGGVTSAAIAFDASEARRVARDVLSDDKYQKTLPVGDQTLVEEDNFLVKLLRRLFKIAGGAIGPVLPVIAWTVVLVGGTLLIVFLVNELPVLADRWRVSARERKGDEAQLGKGPAFDSEGTLADADRLAAESDFAGAIRILLFRSLVDLRERIDKTAFPFLTSRELLDVAPMSWQARSSLAAVVETEELCHFGGRLLDAKAYNESRKSFLRFVDEFSRAAP